MNLFNKKQQIMKEKVIEYSIDSVAVSKIKMGNELDVSQNTTAIKLITTKEMVNLDEKEDMLKKVQLG